MTIRYKCDECGVVMKIKDDLAGKKGKCPQCKVSFLIPELDAAEEELEDPEPPENESEEEDDDDLLDMPMELTTAPVTTPKPAEPTPAPRAVAARSRSRKEASETKKPTRISGRPKRSGGKSDGGEFDPTDVLFDDDDDHAPPSKPTATERPRGRVLGLDEEDDDSAPATPASMSEMFKDFTPAGRGSKRKVAEVASTSAAADALARQAEEKRSKASDPDPIPEEEGFDYVQAAKDLFSQYGLYIGGAAILIFGLYFGMDAMLGSSSVDHPPLHYVEGIVTRSGTPVPGAEIFFTPVADDRDALQINNAGAVVMTNSEGEYEVEYLPGKWGLPAGKYHIRVAKDGATVGVKDIEVVAGQTNVLPFQF